MKANGGIHVFIHKWVKGITVNIRYHTFFALALMSSAAKSEEFKHYLDLPPVPSRIGPTAEASYGVYSLRNEKEFTRDINLESIIGLNTGYNFAGGTVTPYTQIGGYYVRSHGSIAVMGGGVRITMFTPTVSFSAGVAAGIFSWKNPLGGAQVTLRGGGKNLYGLLSMEMFLGPYHKDLATHIVGTAGAGYAFLHPSTTLSNASAEAKGVIRTAPLLVWSFGLRNLSSPLLLFLAKFGRIEGS